MHNPEIIIVPVIFFVFYMIIKTLSDNRIKRILIEKGQLDENTKFLQTPAASDPLNAVKWGTVLISIGQAFFMTELLPRDISDGGLIGMISFFAGVGYLVYYYMAKNRDQGNKGL